MKPSDVAIGKFRELWKQHYGKELSDEIARESAMDILELGEMVYGPQLKAKERAPP